MTGIEAAVRATKDGCQLFRPRKGEPGQYDVKPYFCGQKRGWWALDSFTASAIVAVWNGLNETNRAKFGSLPIHKMVTLAWKLVK